MEASASLPELFENARNIAEEAETLSGDPKNEAKLAQTCSMLEECLSRVETLGLFSTNEDREDLSTVNLKYLLVPFYLAVVEEQRRDGERRKNVQLARKHFSAFVRRCDQYGLLSDGDRKSIFRSTPADPQERRQEKIERFKRQKALKAKAEEIRERLKRSENGRGPGQAAEEEQELESSSNVDDEDVREMWFAEISLALVKAIDLLEALKREDEMLQTVEEAREREEQQGAAGGSKLFSREALDERTAKAEAWHRDTHDRASAGTLERRRMVPIQVAAQSVIEGRGGIFQGGLVQFQNVAGQGTHHDHSHHPAPLFGPASLTMAAPSTHRERLQAQVFQPAHSLPTMSIEEAGMKEMELMNVFQEQNAKYAQEVAQAKLASTSSYMRGTDSDDEEAEVKARSWDDWKDEHPRGAGNKKATPCG